MAEWIGNLIAGLPVWLILPIAILAGLVACASFVLIELPLPGGRRKRK